MCSDYFCRKETKQADESQLWKWYLFISTYTFIDRRTNSFVAIRLTRAFLRAKERFLRDMRFKRTYNMNKRLSGSLQISLWSSKLRFSARYIFPTSCSRGNIRLKGFIYKISSSLSNGISRRVTYLNQSLASQNI